MPPKSGTRLAIQPSGWVAGYALLSPSMLVIAAMLIMPMVALVTLSFWTQTGFDIDKTPTLANYWELVAPSETPMYWMGIPFPLANPVHAILLVKSILMSLAVTVAVILVAYPMAYFLAFRVSRHKALWLILITIPFWTSYLLRVFSWKIMLGFNGVVNSGLKSLGLIAEPLGFLLYNPAAVIITLTHAWVTFAVLPIYVSLEKIDPRLLDAARDLLNAREDWQWAVHLAFELLYGRPWTELSSLSLQAPSSLEAGVLLPLSPAIGQVSGALLDAERGSLFLNDATTNELYSRVAQGNIKREIRLLNNSGIAGHVFTSRLGRKQPEGIGARAAADVFTKAGFEAYAGSRLD
mgnify:CR=1 FL=1